MWSRLFLFKIIRTEVSCTALLLKVSTILSVRILILYFAMLGLPAERAFEKNQQMLD